MYKLLELVSKPKKITGLQNSIQKINGTSIH